MTAPTSHPLRTALHAALALALAALSACQPAPPQAAPALPPAEVGSADASTPPLPASVQSQLQCGSERISARFDNVAGTVSVIHAGGELLLPQAISGSGARYADDHGNELWVKGSGGRFTLSGQPTRECAGISAETAPAR